MTHPRALVLGSSGLVGQLWLQEYPGPKIPVSRSQHNYTNPRVLENLIKTHEPEIVVNCAGYVGKPNVDVCEIERDECELANVYLVRTLSQKIPRDIKFVHFSSGCIFKGSGPTGGFREFDQPNFDGSHYARTKIAGERYARTHPHHYIFRIRMPFWSAPDYRNLVTKLLSYGKILDAENSLSHFPSAISACVNLALTAERGTYHVTSSGSITNREICEIFLEFGLIRDMPDFIDDQELGKFCLAPRSSCVLSNKKSIPYCEELERDVREVFRECVREYSRREINF